ncbi:hypothetical protein B857_03957 [Solibacillus isronensis B3W22]|uniref:Uncharacterized protein n=1 Tax=Solibacillus isronensis B3W22 TaxID=1224748 RepID=K1LFR9_9BACL|nr:hypothetical protein B857_03957 [Solibacillus isronensis B3W22]
MAARKFMAGWLLGLAPADEVAVRGLEVDLGAAHEGAPDLAGQNLALVRGDRVLVVQLVHVDHEAVLGTEEGEVRIVAQRDSTLVGQPGDFRRPG